MMKRNSSGLIRRKRMLREEKVYEDGMIHQSEKVDKGGREDVKVEEKK